MDHTHTHTHTHINTAPAIINPDGNVTTTIPPGGLEYFQTQCTAYTDTVLVELTDLNGTNFLYVSTTEDNPGPLTENTLRNETTGINRRTLTLMIPSGSNVSSLHTQTAIKINIILIVSPYIFTYTYTHKT